MKLLFWLAMLFSECVYIYFTQPFDGIKCSLGRNVVNNTKNRLQVLFMTLSLSSPHEIKYPVFPGSSVTVTYVHSMFPTIFPSSVVHCPVANGKVMVPSQSVR